MDLWTMTETIAVIDYGAGNLRSVARSFERMSQETTRADIQITSDADVVRKADRIVLPGVGTFSDCRTGLDALPGMHEALEERVIKEGVPFFGICVGMQLMAEVGLEHGETPGFGWLKGTVERLNPDSTKFKVPHMGWNNLILNKPHPILKDITPETHVFFVHSYAMKTPDVLATTNHGQVITAAVGRDNLFGTQFHPEKSQSAGLQIIANFLKWKP